MHPRTTTAGSLLAAGLLLTGCNSGSSHDKASTSTTTPHAPATAATTASTAAAPTSEPAAPPGDRLATGARTAACWHAIRDQYTPGTVQLTGSPTEPPSCLGLSTDEVSTIAADVLQHQTDS